MSFVATINPNKGPLVSLLLLVAFFVFFATSRGLLVSGEDDASLLILPKPPACDKRRGRSTIVLEQDRRICPGDSVSHSFVLDRDQVITFELRYTTVEGRRDANSNLRVVDVDGNTVASVNDVLLADNLSRSLVTVRGEPSVDTCGHAQEIFVATGTACVTYQLKATTERRVGFQEAGKFPEEAPTLTSGVLNEFCGSIHQVSNCDNLHWWKLSLETNDVLLIHIIMESNGRVSVNGFMNLLDADLFLSSSSEEEDLQVQRIFFVTVGGGRRRVTHRYTHTGESGDFLLQLGSNLDQYQVAFQIVRSSDNNNNVDCTKVDPDSRKAKVTLPTRTKCKRLKKLQRKNPVLVQNVCFDQASKTAEFCRATCNTCA